MREIVYSTRAHFRVNAGEGCVWHGGWGSNKATNFNWGMTRTSVLTLVDGVEITLAPTTTTATTILLKLQIVSRNVHIKAHQLALSEEECMHTDTHRYVCLYIELSWVTSSSSSSKPVM